jgi:hypothetical protein
MALLWIDGFEGYGTTVGAAPAPTGICGRKYPNVNSESSMRVRDGRFSGRAISFAHITCRLATPGLTTDDTLIVGVAVKRTNTRWIPIVDFYQGSFRGMHLQVVDNGSEIYVMRNGTVIDTTVGANIGVDMWHHVEFKVKCHDTNGEYEVKVDGITVASATGVDTKDGSLSGDYHDVVRLNPSNYSVPYWDDLYICDSTGAQNNDFLGNQRVSAIFPGGGDVTADWETVVPVGAHYEAVDEEEVDDDSSYIEDDDSGDRDIWNYGSVPTFGQIQGLQINTDCKETDATDFTLITVIKSGGTEYDDSPQAAGSGDWLTLRRIAELDPDTSALWTESGINNAAFGVKVG